MSKASSLFGGGVSNNAAEEARRAEEERQQRIAQGTQRVNAIFDEQFSPSFFQGRFQNAMDYWLPQLQKQHTDAQRQLALALSRAGQLNSSVRAQRFADLQGDFETQRQAVVDRARRSLQEEKANVERSRSNLINQLASTADAEGAATQAISQARLLSEPPSFEPLEQLVQDVTAGLATASDIERRRREAIGARSFGTTPSSVIIGG